MVPTQIRSAPPSRPRVPDAVKLVLVALILYGFLAGIGSMGAALKGMGKEMAAQLLGSGAPPLVCLFVGILATTIVQSSSTTSSLMVAAVAGGAIEFDSAVYMIMGANVGTTVTNTIVSLGHITRSGEYQRAFAAATVHDFFNVITLVILFPLQVYTGFLSWLAGGAAATFSGIGGTKLSSPIKVLTKPAIEIVETVTFGNGIAMAIVGLLITFASLYWLVRLLRGLVLSRVENLFDRTVFRTPLVALAFGTLLTAIVQSSSITTSVVVPLVGAGVLTVQQIFPFTMGANIGTTVTAVLAALAVHGSADPSDVQQVANADASLRLAFVLVTFNLVGVAMLWFVRGIPIAVATRFAQLAAWNRLVPIFYIVIAFYLLPLLIIWLGR